MVAVIQKPTLLATALVLQGLQGTGKNKFVEYFGKLFGLYFLTVTCLEHITGNFKYAYFVHANESLYGGDSKEVGAFL
jgi:MoxR-like ATPase